LRKNGIIFQIAACLPLPTTTDTLLAQLDSILQQAGFSVSPAADQSFAEDATPARLRLVSDQLGERARFNADDLPVLDHEWCKGGLGASVNCDVEPPVTVRPGDPAWFREAGVERRFL
jgi:hypothetical protein